MSEQQDQAAKDRILATLEAERVRFINLEFTDVVGMAKCVTIPVEQFAECIVHGKWFDGSALEGFARIAESDMYLFPDLSTFTILPGRLRGQSKALLEANAIQAESEVIARVICEVRAPDGTHFDGDPRSA